MLNGILKGRWTRTSSLTESALDEDHTADAQALPGCEQTSFQPVEVLLQQIDSKCAGWAAE